MKKKDKAVLALADGTVLEGYAFGARGISFGEVVFHTGMTGYQEILTDPSYRGQIVTMTYTQIGNTGINAEDAESRGVWLSGFVVKEYMASPSNFRSEMTLDQYLREHRVIGIEGLDTRFLTRHIRDQGAMTGVLSTENLDPQNLVAKAKAAPTLIGRDLAQEVTCEKPYEFYEGLWELGKGHVKPEKPPRFRVAALDFGIKTNILRGLASRGIQARVLPAAATAEEILALQPDGMFLSNGPGDPEAVTYAVETVRKIVASRPDLPIFGICLGHQILGLAFGCKTIKLKFGHHGANHPVMDLATREVAITSQNHGFAVPEDFFKKEGQAFELTHLNLNDRTVEGMRHRELPIFSVQYHPEASPGPHDAVSLFDRFLDLLEER
jgi:carbamoyl-phosphate synthase small subunit